MRQKLRILLDVYKRQALYVSYAKPLAILPISPANIIILQPCFLSTESDKTRLFRNVVSFFLRTGLSWESEIMPILSLSLILKVFRSNLNSIFEDVYKRQSFEPSKTQETSLPNVIR